METRFQDVPLGKIFSHNGTRYIKDRPGKAQQYGTSKVREIFSDNQLVDYSGPTAQINATGDWKNDPMTDAQRKYLLDLGVDIGSRRLTKKQASDIISAIKNGDSIGQFSMFFFNGDN